MISASGGGERAAVPWMGAGGAQSPGLFPCNKMKLQILLGDVLQAESYHLAVAQCAAKHAQASAQQSVASSLKSTEEVFWDARSNCWACFPLPYLCLTLPSALPSVSCSTLDLQDINVSLIYI